MDEIMADFGCDEPDQPFVEPVRPLMHRQIEDLIPWRRPSQPDQAPTSAPVRRSARQAGQAAVPPPRSQPDQAQPTRARSTRVSRSTAQLDQPSGPSRPSYAEARLMARYPTYPPTILRPEITLPAAIPGWPGWLLFWRIREGDLAREGTLYPPWRVYLESPGGGVRGRRGSSRSRRRGRR